MWDSLWSALRGWPNVAQKTGESRAALRLAPNVSAPKADSFAPICRTNKTACAKRGAPWQCTHGHAHPSASKGGAWTLAAGYTYALDLKLATALSALFAGSTVVEFGAGEGCYTERLRAFGVNVIGAFDGAPGIGPRTSGLVEHANLVSNLTEAHVPRAGWVLCLEVAEHIPLVSEPAFLANLDEHADVGIVLSWGTEWGNGHVNSRPRAYVTYRLSAMGFVEDPGGTLALRTACARSAFEWLPRDILVFRRHALRARKAHEQLNRKFVDASQNPTPITDSCVTYQPAKFTGVYNDGRLCGTCCGAPPDGPIHLGRMCRGAAWDGLLTNITELEVRARCGSEPRCAGYFLVNKSVSPGVRSFDGQVAFRPISRLAGQHFQKAPFAGWMKVGCTASGSDGVPAGGR